MASSSPRFASIFHNFIEAIPIWLFGRLFLRCLERVRFRIIYLFRNLIGPFKRIHTKTLLFCQRWVSGSIFAYCITGTKDLLRYQVKSDRWNRWIFFAILSIKCRLYPSPRSTAMMIIMRIECKRKGFFFRFFFLLRRIQTAQKCFSASMRPIRKRWHLFASNKTNKRLDTFFNLNILSYFFLLFYRSTITI